MNVLVSAALFFQSESDLFKEEAFGKVAFVVCQGLSFWALEGLVVAIRKKAMRLNNKFPEELILLDWNHSPDKNSLGRESCCRLGLWPPFLGFGPVRISVMKADESSEQHQSHSMGALSADHFPFKLQQFSVDRRMLPPFH